MALGVLAWETCHCENSRAHWDRTSLSSKHKECRVLFLQIARHAGTSSQNSILLHHLCRRACELPLSHMNANAAILLHFAMMAQTLASVVQAEEIILLEATSLSPVSSSFTQLSHVFCVFLYWLESDPYLETVLRNCKLLPRFEQPHQEISAKFKTIFFARLLFSARVMQKRAMLRWNRQSDCRYLIVIS